MSERSIRASPLSEQASRQGGAVPPRKRKLSPKTALVKLGRAPPCDDAADANDTGEVDLSDPIFGLNFLFLGGPEPPAPGTRVCGPDPTPDPLGCAVESTHCGS